MVSEECLKLFEKWASELREKAPASMRFTEEEIKKLRQIVSVKCKDGKLQIKGVSSASRALNKSRQTIYYAIAKYYFKKKIRKKEYVHGIPFTKTEFYKLYVMKKGESKAKRYISAWRKFYRMMNKREPLSWTLEDFYMLWNHPELRDPVTQRIKFPFAIALRQIIRYTLGKEYLDEFTTEKLKKKGVHKLSYLSEQHIEPFVKCIDRPDALMMFMMGIVSGARISALLQLKPRNIKFSENVYEVFEKKIRKYVPKVAVPYTLRILKKYINYYGFGSDDRIFPRSDDFYNRCFKKAGICAGIGFKTTSHYVIKHTFVTLASKHGVPLEIASMHVDTEPSTLRDYYLGIGLSDVKYFLIGEGKRPEPFFKWIKKFESLFEQQLEITIKNYPTIWHLLGRKPPSPKSKKAKRQLSEEALINMLKSPSTPYKLKEAWIKKLSKSEKGKKILKKANLV